VKAVDYSWLPVAVFGGVCLAVGWAFGRDRGRRELSPLDYEALARGVDVVFRRKLERVREEARGEGMRELMRRLREEHFEPGEADTLEGRATRGATGG
jgi:hypothetical protein